MIPIFLKSPWLQFNGEEDNLNRGFKQIEFYWVLMSMDITFWRFANYLLYIDKS